MNQNGRESQLVQRNPPSLHVRTPKRLGLMPAGVFGVGAVTVGIGALRGYNPSTTILLAFLFVVFAAYLSRRLKAGGPATGHAFVLAGLVGAWAKGIAPQGAPGAGLLAYSPDSYDRALKLVAVGCLVAWAAFRGSEAIAGSQPIQTSAPTPYARLGELRHVRLWAASTLGFAALVQVVYGVGVVGEHPRLPPTLVGPLFFGWLVLPTLALAWLAYREYERCGRLRTWVHIPIAVLWAGFGAAAGRRAAPVEVALVLGLVWLSLPSVWARVRPRQLTLALGGSLASLAMYGPISHLIRGSSTSDGLDILEGLSSAYARLGGANLLAPILERSGAFIDVHDLVLNYTTTINYQVFGLPQGTTTGFATTIWGVGALAAGFAGVVVAALVIGVAAFGLETLTRRGPATRYADLAAAVRVSFLIAVYSVIQEATVEQGLKRIAVIVGSYMLIVFITPTRIDAS